MDDDLEPEEAGPQRFPDNFDPLSPEKWWKKQKLVAIGQLKSVSRQYAKYGKQRATAGIDVDEVLSVASARVAKRYPPSYAWDGIVDFDVFFSKCIRRSIISVVDKNLRLRARVHERRDVEQLPEMSESVLDQEDSLYREDLQRRLDQAVSKTRWGPAMRKYAQNLLRFIGMSQEEIGEKTGLSPESLSQYRGRIAGHENFVRAARGRHEGATANNRKARGTEK